MGYQVIVAPRAIRDRRATDRRKCVVVGGGVEHIGPVNHDLLGPYPGFIQSGAEPLDQPVDLEAGETDLGREAYDLIVKMEARSGQYARFNRTYAEWSAAFPNSPGEGMVWKIHNAFPVKVEGPGLKATGNEVGAVYMPSGQTGSPMTYMLNGKQFIVVAVSGGNYSGEYIAFSVPDDVRTN